MSLTTKNAVVLSITIAGVVVLLLLSDPMVQDRGYHKFSDSRTLWRTPNFWNVLSNAPFLIIGAWGLMQLRQSNQLVIAGENRLAYFFLSGGVLLVSVGSAFYHLDPNNRTLFWDRLPMTIGFAALFSIVISEFVSGRLGRVLLLPLLAFSVFSVCYWAVTESMGRGDLRLYLITQFLPMLLIPILIVSFKSRFSHTSGYWALLLAYFTAKLFEHYDSQVYTMTGEWVSGHSIKHIVAAAGLYMLLRSFQLRTVKCNRIACTHAE